MGVTIATDQVVQGAMKRLIALLLIVLAACAFSTSSSRLLVSFKGCCPMEVGALLYGGRVVTYWPELRTAVIEYSPRVDLRAQIRVIRSQKGVQAVEPDRPVSAWQER